MLRTLLRPRAILGHLLVLSVAVTCVGLGLWQLDRLDAIRAENQRLAARLELPPVALSELTAPNGPPVDEAALEFRWAEATGTYRTDEEVLQRGQEHLGQAGFHVLTPLELPSGGVVLVRRGWVPSTLSEPPVDQGAPATGTVTVVGLLERPVPQPSFGPQDPDEGRLARVFHTDTARLDRQVDGPLFPMVLRIADDPASVAPGTLPVPAGLPVLDERNHLSYAVQWFIFAGLAVITPAAWWWTRLRQP